MVEIRCVKKFSSRSVLFYILVIFITFLFVAPLAWLLIASFKNHADAIAIPPKWFFKPTLENYIKIFAEEPFAKYLFNSIVIAVSSTVVSLFLGLPAAYVFARFRFSRRNDLVFWVLTTRMMPAITLVVPFIQIMKSFHLIGTRLGVIVAHVSFSLPFAIWMLMDFINSIPKELDEAAFVDGCNHWSVLIRIIIPLTAPGLVATGIFTIILSWNEFLFSLVIGQITAKTLPAAAVGLISFGDIYWGQIGAAAAIIVGPVLVFAMLVQKYLVRGLTFGAVKG